MNTREELLVNGSPKRQQQSQGQKSHLIGKQENNRGRDSIWSDKIGRTVPDWYTRFMSSKAEEEVLVLRGNKELVRPIQSW